jgi:hypothetical protein
MKVLLKLFSIHVLSLSENVWLISCHYSLVNARIIGIYMKLFFTCIISILVVNGKTCQYSNNTFQKRQKSF